jgi:hypothetical protein
VTTWTSRVGDIITGEAHLKYHDDEIVVLLIGSAEKRDSLRIPTSFVEILGNITTKRKLAELRIAA